MSLGGGAFSTARATTSPTSRSSTTCGRSASPASSRPATATRRRRSGSRPPASPRRSASDRRRRPTPSRGSRTSHHSCRCSRRANRSRLRCPAAAIEIAERHVDGRAARRRRLGVDAAGGADRQRHRDSERAAEHRAADHRQPILGLRHRHGAARAECSRPLASLTPVNSPAPSITSVTPLRVRAGAPATLTVTGSGFNGLSVVQWNGVAQADDALSNTQLEAIDSSSGSRRRHRRRRCRVFNPAPGGGTSAGLPVDDRSAGGADRERHDGWPGQCGDRDAGQRLRRCEGLDRARRDRRRRYEPICSGPTSARA